MMRYPREAIMAVIVRITGAGFDEIDRRVGEAGIDPYILEVARTIGFEHGMPFTEGTAKDVAAVAEVNFLHGVLFGLQLAQDEARVEEAVAAVAEDDVQHFGGYEDAKHAELDFYIFQKQGQTYMARVTGPFTCTTIDGNVVRCQDGWLALDAEGYLYPVADSVARVSYKVGKA